MNRTRNILLTLVLIAIVSSSTACSNENMPRPVAEPIQISDVSRADIDELNMKITKQNTMIAELQKRVATLENAPSIQPPEILAPTPEVLAPTVGGDFTITLVISTSLEEAIMYELASRIEGFVPTYLQNKARVKKWTVTK